MNVGRILATGTAPGSAARYGIPGAGRPPRPAAPIGERQFPCRYSFRLRHAGAALPAACNSWRPGHADGLGSLRHAHRDRQPGGDRAGRSRNRRRTAPPDRPSRPHLGSTPHETPRKAAVTDERSDCPGRFGVYRIPDDVPAIPRVAAQSADVVTERYDIRNLLLAFRLTPPESIGNQ